MPGSDLTTRLAGTVALVLVTNVVFALVVAALVEPWLGPPLESLLGSSALVRYGLVIALVLVVLTWIQLAYTRHELLAEVDARPVDESTHPELYARLTRLASLADARVPTVAVTDASVPNSFAVGGLRSGTIVVSEGLLETLPEAELDAVLAHELVHLKNRDAVVMTLAAFLPALASDEYSMLDDELPPGSKPVVLAGLAVVWAALSSTFLDASPLSPAGFLQFVVATAVVLVVGGVALGLLATPVVFLSRSLSRQREFVADRDGARLVGAPGALASALTRLDETVQPPTEDARQRYDGLEGMCLLPHGFTRDDSTADDGTFRVETRSHPPTAERIERLREQV